MEKTATRIGSYAPDFELPGVDDEVRHLARYLKKYRAVGVIFMGNGCPYVELYLERLKKIQADLNDRDFTLIGINANDTSQDSEDSFENMKIFAATHQLNFPYLRDPTQDVARHFGVRTTPEAFLLDRDGVVRYSGAIDDNPNSPSEVRSPYLQAAIVQLLGGEAVSPTETPPVGCSIKWRS